MRKSDKSIVQQFNETKKQQGFSLRQTERITSITKKTLQFAENPAYQPTKQTVHKMSYFICKYNNNDKKKE